MNVYLRMKSMLNCNMKSKLMWYQFSLRTILIFVTLFAFTCSWFGVKIQQAQKQKHSVDAVRKLGGMVSYDYELDRGDGEIEERKPPWAAWLRNDFFGTVRYISISNSKISDADLACLKDLKQIYILDLSDTNVQGGGLEHLKDLSQIECINLSRSAFTGVGIEYLKDMKHLKSLFLSQTQITDASLESCAGMEQIEYLDLSNNRVTDNSIETLKGLKYLKWLDLRATSITDLGIEKIKIALPGCKVEH